MLIKLLLICVLSAIVISDKVRYDNYALYKVYPKDEEKLKYLKDLYKEGNDLDFWMPPTRVGDYVSVVTPPETRSDFEKSLRDRDIDYEVMLTNIQEALDSQVATRQKREITYDQLHWTAYQTLDQINTWFGHLAATHNFVTIIYGGTSFEGRNITGIRIARNSGRRAFILEGGQVGADWLSPTVLTYVVDQLVNGEDPEARAASEDFEWHIFPSLNPDGHQFSQDSVRLWIKNRRPIQLGANPIFGVDLSRNWNSQWGISGGSHNPADNNFIGIGPFSEIESRSFARYIENNANNMVGLLSFRQFGQRFLVPFAHLSAGSAQYNYDEMIKIGRRAMGSLAVRYGTQYLVDTSRNVHDGATGILADWVKYRFNPSIVGTFQLRDNGAWGYTLPVGQVLPSCEETFDAVMAILREARHLNAV